MRVKEYRRPSRVRRPMKGDTMSAHAFRIEGIDQVTHTPVRIELQLVTDNWNSGVETQTFAAPRGFLPTDQQPTTEWNATPGQTSCQRQTGIRPDLAHNASSRGSGPTRWRGLPPS